MSKPIYVAKTTRVTRTLEIKRTPTIFSTCSFGTHLYHIFVLGVWSSIILDL